MRSFVPAPDRTRSPVRRATRPHRRAFTLLETGLAVVIIGVGVLAMIEATNAFIRRNAWSTHSSTATFLANEIREMTRGWPRHDAFSGGIYFEDPLAHTGFKGWGPEPDEALPIDIDDLDDLDGVIFGLAPNPPGTVSRRFDTGPINGFGEFIPETLWSGDTATDEGGQDIGLRGWSQYLIVEKLDANNLSITRTIDYFEPAVGATPEVEVDRFPLRVTVVILYQDPAAAEAAEITRVTWVVPP